MSTDLKASLKINIDAFGVDKIARIAQGLDKTSSATQRLNGRMRDQIKSARALAQAQQALDVAQRRVAAHGNKSAEAKLRAEMKVLGVQQAQVRVANAQMRANAANAAALAKQQAAAARLGVAPAPGARGAVGAGGRRGNFFPGGGGAPSMPSLFALYGYGYMLRHALHTVGSIVSSLLQPAIEFQSAMAQVRMKGGFSAEQTAGLAASAKQMGRTSMFTPTESAQAQIALAASNLSPEQITAAMPVVKKFALAADMGTEEASDALVAVTKQFDLDLTQSNMSMIGGSLVAAANASLTNVRDLLSSLKYVGPLGEMAGQSPAETMSALSLMGDRGIKGSRAGTAGRNMLVSFAKPKGGKATQHMLRQLGLSKDDVAGAFDDIDAFMEKVDARMTKQKWSRGSQVGFFASFFGQYGMTGAAVLAKASTQKSGLRGKHGRMLNAVDERTAAIEAGGASALDTQYAIASETPAAKLAALNARWETFKIDFGERVMPHAIVAIEKMIAVVERLDQALGRGEYDGMAQALGGALIQFAEAARLLEPALMMIGRFAESRVRAVDAQGIPMYGPGIEPGAVVGQQEEMPFIMQWMRDQLGLGKPGPQPQKPGAAPAGRPDYLFEVKVQAEDGTKATIKTLAPKNTKLRTEGNVKQ